MCAVSGPPLQALQCTGSLIAFLCTSLTSYEQALQGHTCPTASERQDLSCTDQAHHELDSIIITVIIMILIIINITV